MKVNVFNVLALSALVLFSSLAWSDQRVPAREFFERSLVKDMGISPDGDYAALTFEQGTEVRLAIMRLSDRQLMQSFEFGDNMHVLQFWWASKDRVVMSVGKVTGFLDNRGRPSFWFAANIDGSQRRQVYDASNALFTMLNPLPNDERHVLIARQHFADRGEIKAHLLDIYLGKLSYVGNQPSDNDLRALISDNDGVLRGAVAIKPGDTLDDQEVRLYMRDGPDAEWESLNLKSERTAPDINFFGFSKDNQYAYFVSDHDMPEDGRHGVFRYDFASNEAELLFRDAHVNAAGLLIGPGGEVIGAVTRQAQMQYSLFEDSAERAPDAVDAMQGVLSAFPEQDVTIVSTSRDGSRNIVFVRSDRNPGEYYLFDTSKMSMEFLAATMPNLSKDVLVPMEPIVVTARDGLELHGFLTRPAENKENLPLIVNVHGGPFGPWDDWSYDNEAQFFAHHGYATLHINFRGSGNRGMDFQRAGWREWGGKMQDDVTDATEWAIEQGIADPNRICIYGGSYGGYAALMGVIKEPDLYQCAVGFVGVYDLPWFRSGDGSDFSRGRGREQRQRFESFMSTAVGVTEEELKPFSPVHHVDRIKADLFIVHGGNDVRVPVGHAHRLRDALDEIGKEYEWMIKEEEGHGFFDVDNRVDMYTAMLTFLNQHIGLNATSETTQVDPAANTQLAQQD